MKVYDFILDGYKKQNLNMYEILFFIKVIAYCDKFGSNPHKSELYGLFFGAFSERTLDSFLASLVAKKVLTLKNSVVSICTSEKSNSGDDETLQILSETPLARQVPTNRRVVVGRNSNQEPQKRPTKNQAKYDPSITVETYKYCDQIKDRSKQTKDPFEWKGPDVAKYFYLRLRDSHRVDTKPGPKNYSQGKSLINKNGGPFPVKKAIDYLFDNWEQLSKKYQLTGCPSLGILLGYGDAIAAEMAGTATNSKQNRQDRYKEVEGNNDKTVGW